MKKLSFDDYGKKAAKRFLKTAIVIDDDIIAPPEATPTDPVDAPDFAAGGEEPAAAPGESAAKAAAVGDPDTGSPSDLLIKPLADAFLDNQIVCGVLKPMASDKDEDVVSRAVKAAAVADIVIVDWYLRKTDDELALAILTDILKSDQSREGRLRLIIVYTSAVPLDDRRKKLAAHLKSNGIQCELDANEDTLIGAANCRIRFVQKKVGKQGKPVESLPELAVAEFSQLSSGLLSNFALLGIGALRDATHHLLATFHRRLDPAFVGHRMLSPDPGDARGFAMSLLMLQIRGTLSLPNRLGGSLGHDEIEAWFDHNFAGEGIEKDLEKLKLKREDLKTKVLAGGCEDHQFHQGLFVPGGNGDPKSAERTASQDFARLATYVREFKGFTALPEGWLPTLTLGTLVRTMEAKPRYFLCVQPACDTVRVEEARYFPFIQLAVGGKKGDNIVVQAEGGRVLLNVKKEPGARHYDKFAPDPETRSIRAFARVEGGVIRGYSFSASEGRVYEWVGDIDSTKAQRIAVDLASTLARVGIDEYEWLRRGGAAKG
ncbi:response regulator receiver domain [Bosea sp. TAF32]|uniref:response regulator receiver domain n=1 Tax=Bosea sp. TAF32 TaxID=3237482 RepID=UPI003F900429